MASPRWESRDDRLDIVRWLEAPHVGYCGDIDRLTAVVTFKLRRRPRAAHELMTGARRVVYTGPPLEVWLSMPWPSIENSPAGWRTATANALRELRRAVRAASR